MESVVHSREDTVHMRRDKDRRVDGLPKLTEHDLRVLQSVVGWAVDQRSGQDVRLLLRRGRKRSAQIERHVQLIRAALRFGMLKV